MTGSPAVERTPAPMPSGSQPRPGLTVRLDALLWVGLVAAAAGLRFARLDALPFTFDESVRAFEALRVSQNSVPDGWSGDLAAAATSYLFRVFADSEFMARAAPAAAGAAAVALVWLGGRSLGLIGALAAGALLAFSPLAVLFSRSDAPFSVGVLLAVAMAVTLLSYLREPRAVTAFGFAVALGLAPSTDAVATTAAVAVVAFLLVEPMVSPEGVVVRAWRVFRDSPSHWLSAVLTLVAALELGLTHFGTSVDRVGLAGLAQWGDMFDLPRDNREPEYQVAVLLAYDWPLVLGGVLGFVAFGWRLVRRGAGALGPGPRLALVWTVVAALTVGLATQREAGQALILVVPLALLGGLLVEDVVRTTDWTVLRRWWPAVAAAILVLTYVFFALTDWAENGSTRAERLSIALALGATAGLLLAAYAFLRRDGTAVAALVVAVAGFAFLAHTGLALVRQDEAAEFAVDIRTSDRIEQFRDTLREVSAGRAGPLVVDSSLTAPLAWYLRDLPVTFGRASLDVGVAVVPDGPLEGFAPVGEPWRLGEGWYPVDMEALPLWRWLVFREPYGTLNTEVVDVRILVPAP